MTRLKKQTAEMQDSIKYLKKVGYKVSWNYIPSKERPEFTTCKIFKDGNEEEHVGAVKKSPKDSNNLKLARFISFQRAIRTVGL